MTNRYRTSRFACLLALSTAVVLETAVERPAFAQKGGAHEEIALAIGETKTISAVNVKEYSEGVKGIVDVVPTPDGKTFVITGKKPGTTTLLLIKNDGQQITFDISVATRNPDAVEKEVKNLVSSFPVQVRRVGSRIFIEGTVPTDSDFRRIGQIVSVYQGQVESLVTVGVDNRKLLIRLDFFFVQYEKTSGYNVGIGWPNSILGTQATGSSPVANNTFTYDFISRTTTTANASVVNQPLPRLDIAQRHGWAKVLKQSSVITANGSEATFQNGGEQNFLLTGIGTAQLASVKFGTNVTVLPRYDSTSRDVEIKLSADVADLTAPTATGGPPGRNTTKLETQITLKLGQALILSGIKTSAQQHNVAGLPGLSEVPVIGLLFATHGDEKQDTEGAVFIVPSVVDTVPKSAIEMINNALGTYKDYQGDIQYLDTYPKTPPSAK